MWSIDQWAQNTNATTLLLAAKVYRCLLVLCCLNPCSAGFLPGLLLRGLRLSESLADKLLHRSLCLHISGRSRIAHQKAVYLKMRGNGGAKRDIEYFLQVNDVSPAIGRIFCKQPLRRQHLHVGVTLP